MRLRVADAHATKLDLDDVHRPDILAELEKRYRAISSELEAVMEVDDLLRS